MTILLFLLFNTLLVQKEETKKFNYESQIGVIDLDKENGICLYIANEHLVQDRQFNIVLSYRSQNVLKAIVLKRQSNSCSSNPEIDSNTSFYSVRLLNEGKDLEKMREQGIAIAVVGPTKSFHVTKGVVSIDLDGDGKWETFRSCTSHEGIHLTVWSGQIIKGKRIRRWHHYYYLGYDVEPSCKARDV